MTSKKKWILLAFVLVVSVTMAYATTVLKLGMEELVHQADRIVVGQCTETQSKWVGRQLVTEVRVSVEQTLKGETADVVVVTLPGGEDSSREFPVAMIYPGAPRLFPQERAVLFLERDADLGTHTIVGFHQGCFFVSPDNEVLSASSSQITTVNHGGKQVVSNSLRQPLNEFLEMIREMLIKDPALAESN